MKEGERHIRFIQMRYCVRRNSDCRGITECYELYATPGLCIDFIPAYWSIRKTTSCRLQIIPS